MARYCELFYYMIVISDTFLNQYLVTSIFVIVEFLDCSGFLYYFVHTFIYLYVLFSGKVFEICHIV